jgi:hypothetical protein
MQLLREQVPITCVSPSTVSRHMDQGPSSFVCSRELSTLTDPEFNPQIIVPSHNWPPSPRTPTSDDP